MTRPTILDLDLVVVPREATDEMIARGILAYDGKCETSYSAMLSASPYPTAWDDVRKYVSRLEIERDVEMFGHETATRTNIRFAGEKAVMQARIAELEKEKHAALTMIAMVEKRLADAERVIEPFADRASDYHNDYPDDLAVVVQLGHLRAARAYMEVK